MEVKYDHSGPLQFAEAASKDRFITNVEDAVDLMGNAHYQGATAIILYEENFCPEFFDLSTRIAGEILQKFSNYRMKLAIVGDFKKYTSKSLRDFIVESNKGGHVTFNSTVEEAKERLNRQR
jgi:hypothetical protein